LSAGRERENVRESLKRWHEQALHLADNIMSYMSSGNFVAWVGLPTVRFRKLCTTKS